MTVSAVILPDNTIAAVLVADATVDQIPPGYPDGSIFVVAPQGCNEEWIYDSIEGFIAPVPPPFYPIPSALIEF